MGVRLFHHNMNAYKSARTLLRERGRAAVVHPTGTGKSFIGFKLCEDNPGKRVLWLSPSERIFQTQLENLASVTDGWQPENVTFLTYAKLALMGQEKETAQAEPKAQGKTETRIERREQETQKDLHELCPDYIVLDEFHRCGARMWGLGVKRLLDLYPNVPVLGLSATAVRYLDSQRDMAEELFGGNIASEMTLGEAVVRGILKPPKYILSIYSYQEELEKYEERVSRVPNKATREAGEDCLEALRRALEKAEGIDRIFDRHMEERHGKYVVFCPDYGYMQEIIDGKVREWFRLIDENPKIYTLYSGDPDTDVSFREFKEDQDNTHLRLLFCIDALNEGVHVEDVSGVILLRPTTSPIVYKQQIGRALSASGKRTPVIFDIVNNIESLYSIDSLREEMRAAVYSLRSLGEDGQIVNESFELLDKAVDCRRLFERLEGALTTSWDLMYEEAKKYFEKHGNLNVQKRYISEDGCALGSWLGVQRSLYRECEGVEGKDTDSLTQERCQKLSAIGMRWESYSDAAWKRGYEACLRYHKEQGNLLVPHDFVTEEGLKLGVWISQMRSSYKNSDRRLTAERIAALEQLGMRWDAFDYRWEKNFRAAEQYYGEHNNLDVPLKYVSENGVHLGQWLNNLRTARRNVSAERALLTEEQIRRLDALGMNWGGQYEKAWEETYIEAKEYFEKHGNLDIPTAYTSQSGKKLGRWIRHQKDKYGKGLSGERVRKLEEIGMSF